MLRFFLASSPIFAVVALGFAAARLRLVAPAGFAAFAVYAFDLALPALLVSLLARQPLQEAFDLRFFGALFAAGLSVFAATAALTAWMGRSGLRIAGVHGQAATNGNLAFLGVPLLLALLGDRATGPLAMAVLAEVRTSFRPEFVNRIDEIVVFQPLGEAQIASIAKIQMKALEARLAKLEIKLAVTDAALKLVAEAGFDPVYGARPLKRAIQQQIENPLAKAILGGSYAPGDTIRIDADGGEIGFAKG